MTIQLRPMLATDVETCGRICYEAFKDVSEAHGFQPDFPTPEAGIQLAQALFSSPSVYKVVAEHSGEIVGSNYLWEFDAVRAVGPITVDLKAQAKGAGRMLMQAVIERGAGSAGIRLVQDSFNRASLSLYASLGFDVREPMVIIEGDTKGELPDGVEVRVATEEDLPACAELCQRVIGFERINEMKNIPPFLNSFVALREQRVIAYTAAPQRWVWNHAVAETEADMHALLTGAGNLSNGTPLSFLLPTRQTDLFRWCLGKGMRVLKPMTLMTMGEYHEPRGCYLPNVGY